MGLRGLSCLIRCLRFFKSGLSTPIRVSLIVVPDNGDVPSDVIKCYQPPILFFYNVYDEIVLLFYFFIMYMTLYASNKREWIE